MHYTEADSRGGVVGSTQCRQLWRGGARVFPCLRSRVAPVISLLSAQSLDVEACRCRRWAMSNYARQRPPQRHRVRVGVKETRHTRSTHWLRTKATLPSPRMHSTKESVQLEKEESFTPQGRHTIYYDDVSSGPRSKAHWYMLTHQCCNDTAP